MAALVFGSGFCALVYQIAWQREFRLVFGASTGASAAVVAVFMAGLGFGGWVLGPRADRQSNPLRFYALLETLVALTAVTTPTLLGLARHAYLSLGGTVVLGDVGGTVVRLLLAALVLAPPTFLAGGTLGAATRAVEGPSDSGRRGMGLLYGANTLGAVLGCVAATFWLLESLGTRGTLWLAALANIVVAAVALAIGGRFVPRDNALSSPVPERTGEAAPGLVLVAATIVGFAFFLMELVWYRMLGPILGGTVYTFGLVLAAALAGVAVGGLLYPAVFARRSVGRAAFIATCLLEAVAIALPYALGDRLALTAAALRPPQGSALAAYLGGWTLVTAIVVFPPSVVAGVQFPLLVALLGRGREQVARDIGRAYFWNTLGGIAGALAGGFGLMPLLTAPGCWRLVALLLTLLALAALGRSGLSRPRTMVPVGFAAALVVALLFASEGPTAVWRHSSIGVGRSGVPAVASGNALQAWTNDLRRSIVWEREGVESSVAIQAIAALSFVVNGKVDGNARNDAPTQVMGGLLGALLNPGARRSLVVGLGTGSTAGWLAAVPGMERVDAVELEPAILDVARMCGPVNHDAMENPKVHVSIGDAREDLMAGRGGYDLVFSEPSNPYRAGIASLFTREFYESVAARLEDRGLFLQWVQAYDVDEWTVSTLIATLGKVFPNVEVWQIHQTDLLLVASHGRAAIDLAGLRRRMREEPFATALPAAWRATEAEDVLARFVAGPELARDIVRRGQVVNTDDHNVVEFAFARTLSRSELFDVDRLRRGAARLAANRPAIDGEVDWDRVARQRVAIHAVAGTPPPSDPDASQEQRTRNQALSQYLAGELAAAARTFLGQPSPAQGAVETTLLAEGLADAGDPRALAFIKALRAFAPTEAEAATARLALRLGQNDLARDALASALVRYRTDAWASQVAMSHALALADELTAAHPDMVGIIFEALGQPFAVRALEEPRRMVRLSVASHERLQRHCLDAVEPFEPHVPWREDVLRFRSNCYQATHDPRAGRARADLEEFQRQEPASPRSAQAAARPAS